VTRRPVAAVAAPLLGMTLLAACSSGPPEGGTGEGVTDTAPATPGRHQPVATLDVPETDLDVVAVYPRPGGFTQGLELLDDGRVLHSTGRYGESQIRVEELGGDVVTSRDLPDEHFGEGVTVVDGTAYQLTWQEEVVHTWSLPDLEPGPTYEIGTEGWGLCHDETRGHLWLSDGTGTLHALGLPGLEPIGTVRVTQGGGPVSMLNELECVDGMVWANVWHTDQVLVIDPGDGRARPVRFA